jgi:hypothetical protein
MRRDGFSLLSLRNCATTLHIAEYIRVIGPFKGIVQFAVNFCLKFELVAPFVRLPKFKYILVSATAKMSRNVASRTKRAESNQGLKAGLGVVPGAIRVKSLEDMRSLEDRGLNDRTIEEAMSEIHQLIIDLIGGFTEIVTLDEWSWPQMSDTNIWFEDLHELFCVALGLQREKTLDHAFRRLDVDRKDLRIYLRMLVAAEISEKVFISSFPEVPVLSREWAKQAFRSLAEDSEFHKPQPRCASPNLSFRRT